MSGGCGEGGGSGFGSALSRRRSSNPNPSPIGGDRPLPASSAKLDRRGTLGSVGVPGLRRAASAREQIEAARSPINAGAIRADFVSSPRASSSTDALAETPKRSRHSLIRALIGGAVSGGGSGARLSLRRTSSSNIEARVVSRRSSSWTSADDASSMPLLLPPVAPESLDFLESGAGGAGGAPERS